MNLRVLFFIIIGLLSGNIQGQDDPLNEFELRVYFPDNSYDAIVSPEDIEFVSFDSSKILEVTGGDKIYLKIEGGSGDFKWKSNETSGLAENILPIGFSDEGEEHRYVLYQVPDKTELLDSEITISVADSESIERSIVMKVIYITEITRPSPSTYFHVVVNINGRELAYSDDFSLDVCLNDAANFYVSYHDIFFVKSELTYSVDATSSTFGGEFVYGERDDYVFSYFANSLNGYTSGQDQLIIENDFARIKIKINILEDCRLYTYAHTPCRHNSNEEFTVSMGNEGPIILKPGEEVEVEALGGFCRYTWVLSSNNSNASIDVKNSNKLIYTAGSEANQVDVLEVTDGFSTKRIEIQVGEIPKAKNLSCFISKKSQTRD
ncbi:MAG: hypothetical protein COA79_15960 [Planctomycetota bacterium]|nr:MAG: hypothetical protein COA79_15960 [Planctomycetota bacterium]